MQRALSLPDWGPYSRHYMGISKVVSGGTHQQMIDFTLVPAQMRGRVVIPDVNFDSGYHPWSSTSDYSYYSVRYDLAGKEEEYCFAEYFCESRGCLLKLTYVNNSPRDKEYSATCFAVQRLIGEALVSPAQDEKWIDAADYQDLIYIQPESKLTSGENYEAFDRMHCLPMGHDGLRRGLSVQENLVGSIGLGNRATQGKGGSLPIENNRTFLMNADSRVTWTGDGASHRFACLRFSMANISSIVFALSVNGCETRFTLYGKDYQNSENQPALAKIALPNGVQVDTLELRTISVEGEKRKAFLIDGWLLTDEEDQAALQSRFTMPIDDPHFQIHRFAGKKGAALTSEWLPDVTVAMLSPNERPVPPPPYSDCSITNVYHSELSSTKILRKLSNDALLNWGSHNCQLYGDRGNHFAGYHAAPIVCRAGEQRTVYMALVCEEGGLSPERAIEQAEAMQADRNVIERRAMAAKDAWLQSQCKRVQQNPYGFSQERLMCNVLSNVTYPAYIKDGLYKTFTPGKRWGGLFTWDSGMLGIGLSEYSPDSAAEIISQYFADPDDRDIDAVLHGTQLPLHIYLLFHLYQKSGNKALLQKYYQSALKYYRYFAGMSRISSYDKFHSGLLCPFEDCYNVEGIDDYPPQHYTGLIGAYGRVSPACTSAHAIRTGKLMALMASELDVQEDIEEIERWNAYLENALQTYAWDEESGYYSYVWNETKKPLYYDEAETINFNMGIDGISPLLAGITDENQLARLRGHLFTLGEMWTPFGITSVDMRAPYSRLDGYWNGKVWIPHQWFFYKALITEGEPESALQIARTALSVWENSVHDTYNCYEQFCSVTGMGEGCHNFGGLSAPVASFFFDMYEKGRVTAGFDSFVRDLHTVGDTLTFTLSTPKRDKRTSVLVCVGVPGSYSVTVGDETNVIMTEHETIPLRVNCARGDVLISIARV